MDNNKDLLKKDFQLLTEHLLVEIQAYQRTLMENQVFIISHLTNTPLDVVAKNIDKAVLENKEFLWNKIKENIPTYKEAEAIKY
jgi:hypothetical protein